MITKDSDIYSYIKREETNYKRPIPLTDAWDWSMSEHIRLSYLYSNSQLSTRKSDFKPVKNITRPILNLQHRTEDIELKDVQIYIDDPDQYHLSFLVKKYHDDVFVRENDLDTFFDELNVSRIDYGAGLSKSTAKGREVVPLQSIAFCDQTDILSGPIGIRHFYSPDQLLDMEAVGWGDEKNGATISVPDLIALSREEKADNNTSWGNNQKATTPGRYIEIYEVHGNMPKSFANPSDTSGKYETRMFICAFYQKKDSTDKQGVILYTAIEKESPFKLIKRDPVYGRALGFGGAEELFEAQVWTNYDVMRLQGMLDAASKTILKAVGSNGAVIAAKNNMKDMDNLSIVDVGDGDLGQVDTYPRNVAIFNDSIERWSNHAKEMGASGDVMMGKEPVSGTPFASVQMQVAQGMSLHEYRRGQFAKHIEEIYTDDFIPKIQKKITEGSKFLSELSLDELKAVGEMVVNNAVNNRVKEVVLSGQTVTQEEVEGFRELVTEEFKKGGNKRFIEILKGEFAKTPLKVKVSVAGKSKNLNEMTDKIVNIWRFAFSNPQGFAQVMQIPGMAKSFNSILELSGLSPVDFSGIDKLAIAQPQPVPQELPAQPMMA